LRAGSAFAAAALGFTGTAPCAASKREPAIELVANRRAASSAGLGRHLQRAQDRLDSGLLGNDPRLIRAHREVVTLAFGELETYAQARRRGGQKWFATGNFAAGRLDHLAARPLRTGSGKGYAPDPQLHTHVVIANLTRRPNGAWRSPLWDFSRESHGVSKLWKFTARKSGATALYRSHFAERL
jgi:hypothetical protein